MKGPSMIRLLQSHLLQSHLLQSCLLQSLLSLSSHPKPIPPHLSSKAWSSQHLLPKNLPHLAPACISFLDSLSFHPQFASKIYTAKRSGSQFTRARFITQERSLFSTNSTGRIVKPKLLGDALLRPMFPPIFLCHLCTSLLIVTVTGITSLHSRSVLGRDSNKELSSIRAKGTSKGCEQSVVD